jgi:hypothetical protein
VRVVSGQRRQPSRLTRAELLIHLVFAVLLIDLIVLVGWAAAVLIGSALVAAVIGALLFGAVCMLYPYLFDGTVTVVGFVADRLRRR